ncbi:DUF2292 domain-containing protein [Paraclostridium sordellii]|uniref:Uncharacterized small protein (DUF2292) n=1 Tax=Paraclostridium sordellii TaxID=1505 RepID=A0A0C7QRK1_PARSO|nr:DUF2292 domain-containing protein [Paeniclostridium sordellii]CEN78186.1 Uncharacterized small protein (DUF2292) [[Clostridium] sordellii] [Paeniclostridium sordellii]CEO07884.1 Uncharacterized small protein (DUF2292) [[Clostridium] sordellii] [Paeniclostridium sordellii]CEP87025.1 Uncharacterized small protein (DUF2292) [[Clostridium] sordellii] [Paeniclostridium sordellii]CEP95362.1 Uncharacterized small protein (DUF2292) [[Clostridium] sordellii] [Paeniclostridium sordellii]CEP99298.1 Un
MGDKINLISEKEKKLLEIIRDINFGEVKIIIQDGLPIRIEELKKSIKL